MKSVLIVDDSRAMRMIVKRALGPGNFGDLAIREAADGRDAFDLVAQEKPDLLLSDWTMREWSGLKLLRSLNTAGLWVPTILVTSESTPEMYVTAREHGALGIVTKPFTPEELVAAVRTATGASARR